MSPMNGMTIFMLPIVRIFLVYAFNLFCTQSWIKIFLNTEKNMFQ